MNLLPNKTEEKEMQARISSALSGAGVDHGREISFVMENERIIADFVAGEWALECKADVSQSAMLKALGQCTAYIATNLCSRAAIVTPEGCAASLIMWTVCQDAGIPIVCESQVIDLLNGSASVPIESGTVVRAIAHLTYLLASFRKNVVNGYDAASRDRIKRMLEPFVQLYAQL